MLENGRSEKITAFGVGTAMVLGLYLSSRSSYLLFHSLIEIVTIAVAFTLFMLTWNTRTYLANNYLRLLGIGYAFISFVDLLHTLAYKGMNVFPGYGANLPTQLWIGARYLQAVTLLAAPLVLQRRADNRAIFGGYAAAVTVLVAMIFSGNFPDCFIEGKGLTAFKIGSEYAITALLLAALYFLYRIRARLNERVFVLIAASIACTALSELSFTAYASVYGFANLAGHFAKLAAFYLIYRAILVTGLKEPFDLIFRELKHAREDLEEQVTKRTAELKAANEGLKEEVAERQQTEKTLHQLNRELRAISDCNQTLMRADDEQTLLNDVCRIVCDEAGYRMAWVGYAENDPARTVRPVAWGGVEDHYLANANITWADTERGRGPTGIAIRTGKTDGIRDFAEELKASLWRDDALPRGYRSSIALPLKDDRKNTFGALTIYSPEPDAFTPGEIRLLEELAGDLAFGITVLRDRIERIRSEQHREAQHALLTAIMNSTKEIIFSLDTHYCYTAFNEKHREEMKRIWDADITVGMNLLDCMRMPALRDLAKQSIDRALQGEELTEVQHQPEPDIYYELTWSPVVQNGTIAGATVFVRDITKRKKDEDALRKLNEDLEQRVKDRTAELEQKNSELEKMNKLFVGRELKMVKLKEQIKELEKSATGRPDP